jgi:alpha-L-rhamnosidase
MCSVLFGIVAIAAGLSVGCVAQAAPVSTLAIGGLKCEYSTNPLGIDSQHPRLSWLLTSSKRAQKQSAYEILVASSEENLAANRGDIWSTGKVTSEQSIQVPYDGRALESGKIFYWKVRVWDQDGNPTEFSAPNSWEMGLLSPSDWQGQWIGFTAGWVGRGLYFHRGFTLKMPVLRARVYVAGIGYSELHINGKRIGENVLDPAFTDYEKRVLYSSYDVTNVLKYGLNGIGVVVGNGWYGTPRLRLQLNITYTDQSKDSIYTAGNQAWSVTASPIMQNSVYDGEVYDARLEKSGWDQAVEKLSGPEERTEQWFPAAPVPAPGGKLVSQRVEEIKIMQTLQPKSISSPKPGIYVFDAGQNLAGWARLKVEGPAGTKVTLKFAELLNDDGTVDQRNLRTALATDEYITGGNGKGEWEPRFTYHGFRYIQVEGLPARPTKDTIAVRVVRSSLREAGSFESSNEVVNRIQKMIWWTEASNLYGIPTDCPQRNERVGWMNDLTVRLEESLYNFDGALFFSKFSDDVQDEQSATGSIADTAPWKYGSNPGDPVDESYLLMGWLLYQNYGDVEVLRRHYDSYRDWVDYLSSRSPNHLINYGFYGDWSPPAAFALSNESAESKDTPRLFMSQGYYFYALQLVSKMATVLGKTDDAQRYSAQAAVARTALNSKYWNADIGGYAANNQAADSFALYLHVAPEGQESRVLENLEKDVEKQNWHLTTGNLATKYLLETLTENGKAESAFRIATQTTYPSWGYMLSKGATTLWERWELLGGPGMNSHNHPMMGSVSSYFYKYLAGIKSDPMAPGFRHTIIHPYLVEGLNWVKANHHTMYGDVAVNWKREGTKTSLKVSVPVNTSATVFVPAGKGKTVMIDGHQSNSVSGVKKIIDSHTFEVGSGDYTFTSEL